MSYLSCLPLNPASRQVQAELRDPNQMHRTLSRAFGEDEAAYKSARCLFRMDERADGRLNALVQCRITPDWGFLADTKGYLLGEPVVKEFSPVFREGQSLAFRLRANPTVKRGGKRLGLYDDEERLHWLARKGEGHGFHPLRVAARLENSEWFTHQENGRVTLSAVRFDGVLRVTDAERLREALEAGIGSGKAFGFGLLSLAPA